ncbi:MAG: MarR family winged helix-turn-helix transcriptional regulator [Actinomycetes bacterium]
MPPLPPGASRTLRHRVANALNTTAIHSVRAAKVDDDRTGLTPERLSLLSVLVYGGPATMSALARAEQVSPPAITRIVGALEGTGLVRRTSDARDRRRTRVSATAAGIRVLERGRKGRIDRLADMLAALDADELRRVSEGLALVRRALRSPGATSAE